MIHVLDDVVKGYIEAALWADAIPFCGDCDGTGEVEAYDHPGLQRCEACEDAEYGNLQHLRITDDSLNRVGKHVLRFLDANASDCMDYFEARCNEDGEGSTWEWLGHDLRLTERGHGTGFWDRGIGELGERLSEAAKLHGTAECWEQANDTVMFDRFPYESRVTA